MDNSSIMATGTLGADSVASASSVADAMGHLHVRMDKIEESLESELSLQVLVTMVESLAHVVDQLDARITELENKRG